MLQQKCIQPKVFSHPPICQPRSGLVGKALQQNAECRVSSIWASRKKVPFPSFQWISISFHASLKYLSLGESLRIKRLYYARFKGAEIIFWLRRDTDWTRTMQEIWKLWIWWAGQGGEGGWPLLAEARQDSRTLEVSAPRKCWLLKAALLITQKFLILVLLPLLGAKWK